MGVIYRKVPILDLIWPESLLGGVYSTGVAYLASFLEGLHSTQLAQGVSLGTDNNIYLE
jgi:hypothetical protein